jgi:hypothetical protein
MGICADRVGVIAGSGPGHRGSLLTTVTSMDSPITRPGSLTAVPETAARGATVELLQLDDSEKQDSSPRDNCLDRGNTLPLYHSTTTFL